MSRSTETGLTQTKTELRPYFALTANSDNHMNITSPWWWTLSFSLAKERLASPLPSSRVAPLQPRAHLVQSLGPCSIEDTVTLLLHLVKPHAFFHDVIALKPAIWNLFSPH